MERRVVVPPAWVDKFIKQMHHLIPGEHELSSSHGVYYNGGFPASDTDYTASGVYNQYIYIYPLENIVQRLHPIIGSPAKRMFKAVMLPCLGL